MSPDFFALYMHDLIAQLTNSGYGTHVIMTCIACIFFADDVVLLSPSRHGLQNLLDICVRYCEKFCLDFNVNQTASHVHSDYKTQLWNLSKSTDILVFIYEHKMACLFLPRQQFAHSIGLLTRFLMAVLNQILLFS